jgi:hypothetical protein
MSLLLIILIIQKWLRFKKEKRERENSKNRFKESLDVW